jgi:hypothetical protein
MEDGGMTRHVKTALEKLSPRRRLFVLRYVESFNATRAVKAAGYSKKGAAASGSNLLRDVKVAAAVDEQMEKRGLTPDRIKSELAKIAFDGDVTELEPWLSGKTSLDDLRIDGFNTKLIESFSNEPESGKRSVKMHSKLKAMELLVRVMGMITETRKLEGGENVGKNTGPAMQFVFHEAKAPQQKEGDDDEESDAG